MKRIVLLSALLWPLVLIAQDGIIKGKVSDTIENKNLSLAVVSFLNASDSTLESYTRTDQAGNFSKKIPNGSYIILVTSPTYADFVYPLEIKDNSIDLNNIILTPRASLMATIIITQKAIRIKGDTTEYIADSFRVKPNATVEDLLKELPGIQVDKFGKITAQGQTVQKILVDGDEFFSDDPTIAIRNLRADAIKKVQVFDKQSEQSAFTGIDDGNKQKTINLELKDDAKRGYFGKVSAAGLDRYYNLQAMINAFRDKRKLAAFAIASSTSETGLDWQNSGNYGFNTGNVSEDASTGSVSIHSSSNSDLGSGNYQGTGLPESVKAGLHYSNKWQQDKYDLATNYLLNNLKVHSRLNNFSQNALFDSLFYTKDNSETRSARTRHAVTSNLEIQLDSSSSLLFNGSGYTGTSDYLTNSDNQNISERHQLVNASAQTTQSDISNGGESLNILYRKKLKRPGQTFSLNLSQSYSENNSKNQLFNASSFYDNNGILFRKDTTDQKKNYGFNNLKLNAKVTFTQPLSKTSFIVFDYAFGLNTSKRNQLSYNKGSNNKYELLVDSLSNRFDYDYFTNTAGINYRFVKNNVNLSFGGSVTNTDFHQHNLVMDTSYSNSYLSFFPRAEITYKFTPFSNIRVSYNGALIQPSIDQIQPLVDNSDPLNLVVGNPDLKQSFEHSSQLQFTSFKQMSQRYLMLGASFTLTQDEITTSFDIDDFGRRITKYVNTNGNYTAGIFGAINIRIPESNWRMGTGPILWIYRYSSFANGFKNITNTANLSWRIRFDTREPNKYDLSIIMQPAFRSFKSTISKVANTNYWTSNFSVDGSYQLPLRFEIGSDVNIDIRQKTRAFTTNNNIILWNAYLEKRFLKNESLALRVSMHDILDQSKGYSRFEYNGTVQEQRYLTFGQYGLIGLTYNFVNKGGSAPQSGGGIKML